MDEHERRARLQTRKELLAHGIPTQHVDQVVDLGFHAARRAVESMHDVVFSAADSRISMTALGIAIGVAEQRLAALQAEVIRIASGAGLPVRSFQVSTHGEDGR